MDQPPEIHEQHKRLGGLKRMAAIYVREQGAVVQKLGERIVISRGGSRLLDIPVFQADSIVLIGNVQVTAQALYMLMEHGVDVSYLSYSGKYLGHTAAESSRNIFLRLEQYQYYLDMERRVGMAKAIVGNKIKNQMSLIRLHRWEEGGHDWKSDLKRMEGILASLEGKETPNEILGVEGICSQIYFGAFAIC